MALQIFANNAAGYLSSSIADTDVTITLQAGQGAAFPSPSGGTYFYITLYDGNTTIEICKCTARSTDTLTVVRGQEGTVASAFASGSLVEVRTTAATLTNFLQSTGSTATDLVVTSIDVNGGSIDGTTIGANSRSTGLFTTIGASGQITSTVTTGTAPFVVASTTLVSNLNANYLSGKTFADPGPIGSTTASTGAFTTLSSSGNFAVATNKFNVTATTGDTAVAGTLSVGGAATFTSALSVQGLLSPTSGLAVGTDDATAVLRPGGVNTHLTITAVGADGNVYIKRGNGATAIGTFSASGLSITGAVSASGITDYGWAASFINTGTTNAHGLYVKSGASGGSVPLRVDIEATQSLTMDNSGNLLVGTTNTAALAAKTVHLGNATVPTGSITDGGILYVEAGALKYRGSSGTVTVIAPA